MRRGLLLLVVALGLSAAQAQESLLDDETQRQLDQALAQLSQPERSFVVADPARWRALVPLGATAPLTSAQGQALRRAWGQEAAGVCARLGRGVAALRSGTVVACSGVRALEALSYLPDEQRALRAGRAISAGLDDEQRSELGRVPWLGRLARALPVLADELLRDERGRVDDRLLLPLLEALPELGAERRRVSRVGVLAERGDPRAYRWLAQHHPNEILKRLKISRQPERVSELIEQAGERLDAEAVFRLVQRQARSQPERWLPLLLQLDPERQPSRRAQLQDVLVRAHQRLDVLAIGLEEDELLRRRSYLNQVQRELFDASLVARVVDYAVPRSAGQPAGARNPELERARAAVRELARRRELDQSRAVKSLLGQLKRTPAGPELMELYLEERRQAGARFRRAEIEQLVGQGDPGLSLLLAHRELVSADVMGAPATWAALALARIRAEERDELQELETLLRDTLRSLTPLERGRCLAELLGRSSDSAQQAKLRRLQRLRARRLGRAGRLGPAAPRGLSEHPFGKALLAELGAEPGLAAGLAGQLRKSAVVNRRLQSHYKTKSRDLRLPAAEVKELQRLQAQGYATARAIGDLLPRATALAVAEQLLDERGGEGVDRLLQSLLFGMDVLPTAKEDRLPGDDPVLVLMARLYPRADWIRAPFWERLGKVRELPPVELVALLADASDQGDRLVRALARRAQRRLRLLETSARPLEVKRQRALDGLRQQLAGPATEPAVLVAAAEGAAALGDPSLLPELLELLSHPEPTVSAAAEAAVEGLSE